MSQFESIPPTGQFIFTPSFLTHHLLEAWMCGWRASTKLISYGDATTFKTRQEATDYIQNALARMFFFLQSHRGEWRGSFYNFWECIRLSQDNDLPFMTYITPDITPMNHIRNEAFSFLWARLDPRNLQRGIKDGEWYSSTLALGNPSDECML